MSKKISGTAEEEIMVVAIAKVILFGALIVIAVLLNGFAISVLWGWFLVPPFGLPELSTLQAIGIASIVIYLTHQYGSMFLLLEEYKGDQVFPFSLVITFFRPLFFISFGYIIHLLM